MRRFLSDFQRDQAAIYERCTAVPREWLSVRLGIADSLNPDVLCYTTIQPSERVREAHTKAWNLKRAWEWKRALDQTYKMWRDREPQYWFFNRKQHMRWADARSHHLNQSYVEARAVERSTADLARAVNALAETFYNTYGCDWRVPEVPIHQHAPEGTTNKCQ